MWLQAGLGATFILLAQCCSDFLSKTASGQYHMSARNLDHGTSMDIRFRGLKAGSQVSLLQACPTCQRQTMTTKYDIAGFTAFFDYQFFFVDGMNSEGLGAGSLTDDGVISTPEWDPSGPTTTVPYVFVVGYILANFRTVAEVQAKLTPSLVQFTRAYIGSQILPDFPLEIAIHDALGNSAVLVFPEADPFDVTQFGQPQPPNTPSPWAIIPNPQHTLTNAPGVPYQNAALEYFKTSPHLIPEYVHPYLQRVFGSEGRYEESVKAFLNLPGDDTSISRRIRLYAARELQGQGNWPNHATWASGKIPISAEVWSPNYGSNEWWQSFVTAANGILHVSQLNGFSDQSLIVNPDLAMNNPYNKSANFEMDQTIISIIRDHTTRQIFWWSLRAQRWQGYDLKTMTQSFMVCVTPLHAVTSTIYDRTATVNNLATNGNQGVAVSATGSVPSSACINPSCPATLSKAKGIRIKCVCNGEYAVNDATGCKAPLTQSQVLALAKAYVNGEGVEPLPRSKVGSLTVQVTDCKSLSAQQCCDALGMAVAKRQTPLPSNTPISCLLSSGGTLAAQRN